MNATQDEQFLMTIDDISPAHRQLIINRHRRLNPYYRNFSDQEIHARLRDLGPTALTIMDVQV